MMRRHLAFSTIIMGLWFPTLPVDSGVPVYLDTVSICDHHLRGTQFILTLFYSIGKGRPAAGPIATIIIILYNNLNNQM